MHLHVYAGLAGGVKFDVSACMSKETEANLISQPVMRVWIRLMRAQRIVLAAIEADLKAAGLPPLAWYDVLLELTRTDEGRLRPFEIERRTLMTQYNLSRLLDRLTAKGLVRREAFGEDGRGQWIVVTDEGRATQTRIWSVYSRSLHQHVAQKLDDESAKDLADLLAKLTREA